MPSGALPLWTPHSCRRGLGGQGEERPLPPLTEAWVIPWASRPSRFAVAARALTPIPFNGPIRLSYAPEGPVILLARWLQAIAAPAISPLSRFVASSISYVWIDAYLIVTTAVTEALPSDFGSLRSRFPLGLFPRDLLWVSLLGINDPRAKSTDSLGLSESNAGWSGRGSRFAQRPRSGPDLDALERPQRSGLVVRGALPLTACHVANGQAPLGGRVSRGCKA